MHDSVSLFVVILLLLMLSAIQLDYELFFDTGEIGNVFSDRILAAKSVAVKLFAPQCLPQHALDIGHIGSQ